MISYAPELWRRACDIFERSTNLPIICKHLRRWNWKRITKKIKELWKNTSTQSRSNVIHNRLFKRSQLFSSSRSLQYYIHHMPTQHAHPQNAKHFILRRTECCVLVDVCRFFSWEFGRAENFFFNSINFTSINGKVMSNLWAHFEMNKITNDFLTQNYFCSSFAKILMIVQIKWFECVFVAINRQNL